MTITDTALETFPIWAYSSYNIYAETGEFENTCDWAYRVGPDAEVWAYARYDAENGQSAPEDGYALAVTLYRIDAPMAVDMGEIADYMDEIEWSMDWSDPAVTVIKRNQWADKREAFKQATVA